jgi:hypothetical protein
MFIKGEGVNDYEFCGAWDFVIMSLTYKFDPNAISISARFYAGEYFFIVQLQYD